MAEHVDLIDVGRLQVWLNDHVKGDPPLTLQRMGEATGVGNALFDVQWGDRALVLRRPPPATITASAGDTMRERRLLAALADTDVRHPRLVAACDDTSVIGVPFILMERIDGFTPIDPLPNPFDADPPVRRGLGMEVVDVLAELALVDWPTVGLEGFGKPDGFLARQVDRWLWQLDSYRGREIPELDTVTAWLRRNLPEPGPIGIMHGDYSMFNVMFSHGAPARLVAILDWDTATIGETLMDLGHLLARWDETGEEPTALGSADNPNRSGLPSRAELAARYAERTGFDLRHLRYYEVLSLFKLGCIMEGHYAAAVQRGDPTGGRFSEISLTIIRDARASPGASGHERASLRASERSSTVFGSLVHHCSIGRGARTDGAPVNGPESTDLRQRRRAFTADEIERVAIELFAAHGFGEVTVDEIAEAAGVSPRTFFRYFPTKADVVRAHQRRLIDRLVGALAARPADDGPVTALREAFLATTQMRAEDRERIVLVGRLLASAGDGRDIGFDANRTDELVAVVARHAGLDPVRDIRPAVVVAAMTGAAQAAFRAWVESGGTVELATMVADALDILDDGLAELDRVGPRGNE